ncbi:MAG TPA: hypothetical protein K8V00_01845 [Ligilactobacillus acidipiscis]|uniref:Uncharacterized protein n=1 Tax=Ligilactobacillus acidipiscis TaxID=89059 RepID=A0A921JZM9_9LACO|nr:hypothetical protein [Ligilactobacillus acidipiscis]
MSKYYRVRSQQEWSWLVNRFGQSETQWPEQGMSFGEIRECLASGGFVIVHNDYFPSVGSVLYTAAPQNNGNVIEVSDLMEGEKMKDYVEIKGSDLFDVTADGPGVLLSVVKRGGKNYYDLEANSITKIGIPTRLVYPKVRMSVAEKKEFDELKNYSPLLSVAITRVDMAGGKYQHLYSKFFNHETTKEDVNAQNDFARAWADESLIEVFEPVKFKVKVPNSHSSYYFKSRYGKLQSTYE